MQANQAVILGEPVRVRYTWKCGNCSSTYNDWDFRELEARVHLHFQQQHGPLDGQGELGFDIDRKAVENPT